MARLDSRLESEGAEFLVCGHLLIEGIPAYKSYTNMPGYDLIAVNPDSNSSARIQVKSRWATGSRGFIQRNFETDFVVFAALNRGFRSSAAKTGSGKAAPEFFVFPVDVVRVGRAPNSKWGRVERRLIPDFDSYRDRWQLIREFLLLPEVTAPESQSAGES